MTTHGARCGDCPLRSATPSPPRTFRGISPKSKEQGENYGAQPRPYMGTSWSNRHDQVKLKNELHNLRRDFKELTRQHDRAENKVWNLRDQLKDLKTDASGKSKDLDLAKRTIDRLTKDKNRLEEGNYTDKAYIKKLESKLSTLKATAQIQSKCGYYKNRVRELEDELRSAETRLNASEEVCEHKGREVRSLERALEVKAREYSIESGVDVHSRLLFAVAKGEDECVRLAMQLSELRATLRQMEEKLKTAEDRADRMREESDNASSKAVDLKHQLLDTSAACRAYEKEASTVREEIRRLQKQVEDLMFDRDQLTDELRREKNSSGKLQETLEDTKRTAKMNLDALRSDMEVAVERATARMAEQRSVCKKREQELDDQCAKMESQVEELKGLLESSRRAGEQCLQCEKAKSAKLEDEIENLRESKRNLEEEANNLHAQLDDLSETNNNLQDKLMDSERRNCEKERKLDGLDTEVRELQTNLEVVKGDKATGEGALRGKIECLLRELTVAIQEKDSLRTKLQDTTAQLKSTQGNNSQLEQELKLLKETNESLNQSKGMLQNTMLEQIANVRSQLEEARVRNQRLERNLATTIHSARGADIYEAQTPISNIRKSGRQGGSSSDWLPEGCCKRWASETPMNRGPGATTACTAHPSSTERATASTGGSTAVREWREEVNRAHKGVAMHPDCFGSRQDGHVPSLEEIAYFDTY